MSLTKATQKNAERTIKNCIMNPNTIDSQVPYLTTGDHYMVGHSQRGHYPAAPKIQTGKTKRIPHQVMLLLHLQV